MKSTFTKQIIVVIGLIVFLTAIIWIKPVLQNSSTNATAQVNLPTSPILKPEINTFEYNGREGKNALEILQEKVKVELDSYGMVASINSRKSDKDKSEFWAFYINGKMAQIGPKDYITKDTDRIEWRIEKY